jgi:hypothetical protein
VIAKAPSLPLNNRPWLNKEQSIAPTTPQACKKRPENSINGGYSRTSLRPLVGTKLMAKRGYLQLQRKSRAERVHQDCDHESKYRVHTTGAWLHGRISST